jgi:hypothetical protein
MACSVGRVRRQIGQVTGLHGMLREMMMMMMMMMMMKMMIMIMM